LFPTDVLFIHGFQFLIWPFQFFTVCL
jgi:hypothetical protein